MAFASRFGAICSISALCLTFVLFPREVLPAYSTEKTLHAFQCGSDGAMPSGGLIKNVDGDLYGATGNGGGSGCQGVGCGTVFKIATGGAESVLYAFQGGSDGAGPIGSLLKDAAGNLFGTTAAGGNACSENIGCGTVFELTPDGTETVLYAFLGGSDGIVPQGSLIADANGDLFGVTSEGGSYNGSACAEFGCGTVFELQPNGNKTTLYSFSGGSDGELPSGGLIADAAGNLYGTTEGGGTCSGNPAGCGTVFKVTRGGAETVFYTFQGGSDGEEPLAGLIVDSSGNFYGTTLLGGDTSACSQGCGTVFKISSSGVETILYGFHAGSDGASPEGPLTIDKSGNLYGTTYFGGGTHCGCGTIFKLAPNGTETVLYSFYPNHGEYPAAGLLKGAHGNLYGTTTAGGTSNDGVVFRIKK